MAGTANCAATRRKSGATKITPAGFRCHEDYAGWISAQKSLILLPHSHIATNGTEAPGAWADGSEYPISNKECPMTKAIPRFCGRHHGESLPMILLSMILLESIGCIRHFCRLLVHTSYVAMPLRDGCSTRPGPKSCIIMHDPASLGCGSHCLRGNPENPASLASGSHCLRKVPCILGGADRSGAL